MTLLLFLKPQKFTSDIPGDLIDTHDGYPRGKRKKKDPEFIKKGYAELRIVPGSDYKFSIREALRSSDLQLSEEEEEFMLMLLMGEYDD